MKAFRQKNEQRLQNNLISQGSSFSNIVKNSTLAFNSLWSSVHSKLPKNIFNFILRYINNSLPTRKNLVKWGLSSSADCSFCFCPESLLHVNSGCKTYLDEGRYTWRHNSVLNLIASSLLDVERSKMYVDLPGFISPSVITGDKLRPDLLLTIENKILYILELTVGFETNLKTNSDRKHEKYLTLITDQENVYDEVFVNVSISSLGVFGESTNTLFDMLHDLKYDEQRTKYPKNKILTYTRYVLSKLSWHLTVATLPKTWIAENLDSIVNQYIRKWLEVPISGTLSNVYLTSNKFGLNVILPSTKFVQCQTTIRTALKLSPNESIKHLWKSTSNHTNIQYDQYSSTKDVIKSFHENQEDKLKNHLTCQGSFFFSIFKFSLAKVNTIWPTCQSKLPKNIFNFTIRYINNSLPTRKNLNKWGISLSPENERFVFILKLYYMLLLVAVRTWIDLLGDTTQSSILLPIISHQIIFRKFSLIYPLSLILRL